MRRNIPWIWLAVLLLAGGLVATSCFPAAVEVVETEARITARPSSKEVDPALTLTGQKAPQSADDITTDRAAEPSTIEPPERAPDESPSRCQTALDQRQAELEMRERRLEEREARAAARTESTDENLAEPESEPLVSIDRFRAIPIEPARERPERAAAAKYREISLLVPAGTAIEVEFLDTLSSERSQPGDSFSTRVIESVTVDGYFAIPAGAEIRGVVADVQRLKKIGGQARLLLDFDRIYVPSGEEIPLVAALYDQGRSETSRDAATIGAAAAVGAIVGGVAKNGKKGKGRVIGALIGAVIGTGIAARTAGEAIEIPVGTAATLILDEDLSVSVRVRIVGS